MCKILKQTLRTLVLPIKLFEMKEFVAAVVNYDVMLKLFIDNYTSRSDL